MNAVSAARVEVLNEQDQTLYSEPLYCSPAGRCELTMANYVPPKRLSFRVFNSDNQLVSASDILSTDRDSFALRHSNAMLGMHLFKRYTREYGLSRQDALAKIDSFFAEVDSPDGTVDNFEELGMLYAQERTSRGLSESEFFSELNQRLNEHVVLPPNYFGQTDLSNLLTNTPPVLSSTEGHECPWYAQGILAATEIFGKFIPYVGEEAGKYIGKVVSRGGEIACDESAKTTELLNEANEKLDEIQHQLDLIDAKIDAMDVKLDDIRNAVYDVMNLTAQINYRAAIADSNTYINIYRNLLGSQYKNMAELVQARGGLMALSKDSTVVKLLTDIGKQNQAFNRLADENTLRAMVAVIENKCASLERIPGDVVGTRAQCNLLIARMSTEYSMAQTSLATLLKDQILAVNLAIESTSNPDTVTDIYTSPFRANWATAQDEVNAALQVHMTAFTNTLGSAYIEVISGMPTGARAAGLFTTGCSSDDRKPVPNISQWFPRGESPYFVSHCYNGGRMVESRYYYKSDDPATPVYKNILGVIVRTDVTSYTDRQTPWAIAGTNNPLLTDDFLHGLAVKMPQKSFAISNNSNYPPSAYLEPGANFSYLQTCESSYSQSNICQMASSERFILKKLKSDAIFDYYTSGYRESNYSMSRNDFVTITGKTPLIATVAYTPEPSMAGAGTDTGVTLIWQVLIGDTNSDQRLNNWRMRCLTDDCSADGNTLRFKGNSLVGSVSLPYNATDWRTFEIKKP